MASRIRSRRAHSSTVSPWRLRHSNDARTLGMNIYAYCSVEACWVEVLKFSGNI